MTRGCAVVRLRRAGAVGAGEPWRWLSTPHVLPLVGGVAQRPSETPAPDRESLASQFASPASTGAGVAHRWLEGLFEYIGSDF